MSIRYLLDTNILVHYVRNSPLASRIEADYGLMAADEAPIISIASEAEIRSLALQFGWRPSKRNTLSALLSRLLIVPMDKTELVEAYAHIDFFSERDGHPMGKNDV